MARLRRSLTAVTAAPLLAAAASPALAAAETHDGTTPTPEASPCCAGGHYVTWDNHYAGLYLHVKANSTGKSAQINMYGGSGSCKYHGTTDLMCSEEWSQISTAYAHQFAYANINSGLCLDDGENKAGGSTVPTQYSCADFPDNMRWIYGTITNSAGSVYYNALYTAYGDHSRILCGNLPENGTLFINSFIAPAYADTDICDWL